MLIHLESYYYHPHIPVVGSHEKASTLGTYIEENELLASHCARPSLKAKDTLANRTKPWCHSGRTKKAP